MGFIIYLLFFLSGAAALIYEVIWVRSLGLVFGGSNLAVTTVLSIFMGGLALGGYAIGRSVDSIKKPLRLYGLLEIGIAVSALFFMALMRVYPSIYVPLAQGRDDSLLYLSIIRVLFSALALIIPTTLMGGTLPVLSRFISHDTKSLRTHLAFLYGINTLGAVVGAAGAGFFLMRLYSISTTLYVAILINLTIGLASLALQYRQGESPVQGTAAADNPPEMERGTSGRDSTPSSISLKLVLWGIGVSGFCALGYEILWTRILTIAVGASVYGFTTMLVAFLTGIALGGYAYGCGLKIFKCTGESDGSAIRWFGIVQVLIGVTALLVTIYLRYIPANVVALHRFFSGSTASYFAARAWSSFLLAFSYMFVPAFFMGLAFPLAGRVHARHKHLLGSAVGEILAFNTVGAILGAALSGYLMVYLLGIERSLQVLIVINVAYGFIVLASAQGNNKLSWSIAGGGTLALLFLITNQHALRIWDMKYFAVFRSNQIDSFDTPEHAKDTLANTEVLYYGEGVESIVSSIKVKGGEQSFITNGRVEASSHLQAQQCQYVLGHLPMLLHSAPRNVLVVGLGSGMTLGATSVHPTVREVTLVELEPKVLGVAKSFKRYNHNVLESPRLKIVFNDGRNFLLITKQKYDVITADPIHPWFRGAGYLYTSEYFKLAAQHLTPGGIVCQWLPLYELTPADLKSIVKTVGVHFKYTMLWLTHYDAEIIASNSPITFDEAEIEKRIHAPLVQADLNRVMMGSADDFLSYFLMGSDGMRRFSREGIINTDDNLYIEFDAPLSMGRLSLMGDDVEALLKYRENILPYIKPAENDVGRVEQQQRWATHSEAMALTGSALTLLFWDQADTPAFENLLARLSAKYPSFAPSRFLINEYYTRLNQEPRLIERTEMALLDEAGYMIDVEISAVLVPVSAERTSVAFVDNDMRTVYGETYVDGRDKGEFISRFAHQVIMGINSAYAQETEIAARRGKTHPQAGIVLDKIRQSIASQIRANSNN